MRSARPFSRLALFLSIALVGCGGDDLVLPDAPGAVQIVDGNGQEGRSGDVLADPLVVRLVDEAGQGIPEQTVRWVPLKVENRDSKNVGKLSNSLSRTIL
jgi:hypothetical protein